jgi:heavy metal sensor kinase
MKPLSLRLRLALIYAVLSAVVLAGFGAVFYRSLAARLERGLDQDLEERAAALRGYLRFPGGRPQLVFDQNDPEEAFFIHTATRYFQVMDATSGEVLVQSQELQLLRVSPSLTQVQDQLKRPHTIEIPSPQGPLRFHSYVVNPAPRQRFLIQVGASRQPIENALQQFLYTVILLIPVGVLLAAASGWWTASRALRPLEDLTASAAKIGISNLSVRVPLRGSGDELDRLAETFNRTVARLEDAVQQMRQFTASISHELRTPLTALRGEAEVALMEARSPETYRKVLASQLEEFDKLTQMINRLLTLARAEGGEIHLASDRVNISALVSSLTAQMEPLAAWKRIQLRTSVQDDIYVSGDRDWLECAVLNLLDNAIKFTPQGGSVSVMVTAEDHSACLDVQDTGVGIPAEALPHVFERFYRAEPSRSKEFEGAGLGLALVKWVVESHRGHVTVESHPGRGSRFQVWLPAAAPFRQSLPLTA